MFVERESNDVFDRFFLFPFSFDVLLSKVFFIQVKNAMVVRTKVDLSFYNRIDTSLLHKVSYPSLLCLEYVSSLWLHPIGRQH